MDYRFYIARRYLASRKRVSLISIITGISVVGITVGVAMLVVVLSVLNGFYGVVQDLLLSFDPHVRVVAADARGMPVSDSLERKLTDVSDVQEVTPYVEGKALFTAGEGGQGAQVVVVRGVKERSFQGRSGVENMVMGAADLSMESGHPGILVGRSLALRFGLYPRGGEFSSSKVGLLSAQGVEEMVSNPFAGSSLRQFSVRGVYEMTGGYDKNHVFVALDEAQRLFNMHGEVSGVDVRLQNPDQANEAKQEIQQVLGSSQYQVETWYELQKSLYDVMRLEKWGATLILSLIVLVAAFNIVGSLTMVVIEKRRDLGVLQALGVSKANIRKIFLYEGALIGVLGCGGGLLLGLGLAYLQKYTGLVSLYGGESFIIDAYPVAVQWQDPVLIVAVTLILCLVAAIYPASRASSVAPARAIHDQS